MRVLSSIILLLFSTLICGQVTVTFKNATYKGDTIHLKTISDYITGIDTVIGNGVVDNEGNYICSFNLKKTALIKIPLYFFEGMLYAEPGKTYIVDLPKKTPVPVHAGISPFFSPMPFFAYLPADKPDELNNVIFTFDSIYDDYITKNSSRLLFDAYKSKADTFITKLESRFEKYNNNRYFRTYMLSKTAMLHYMTNKRDLYYVMNYYLNKLPVSPENNAYMDLFNNLFRDFFRFYSLRTEGKTLYDDVAKAKSPYSIRQTFSLNPVFVNDTVNELIILKGLHDSFFPGNENVEREFPSKQLYITVDSVRLQARYYFSKQIAENIIVKTRSLYKAAEYQKVILFDCNDKKVALSSLKTTHVYMAFYDTRNYTCQKELKIFTKLAKKMENKIRFVLVVVNPEKSDFTEFCKKNEYPFSVLYAPQDSPIFDLYELKAFPHYMIFDPYGYAVVLAAPSPTENLESVVDAVLSRSK